MKLRSPGSRNARRRSEEHTSELQSQSNIVCRLLLEKKKISNDGINKLNTSRKASVSYKVQRTITANLNAATITIAVSSNPNFVTRQKLEIIFGSIQNGRSLNELNRGQSGFFF